MFSQLSLAQFLELAKTEQRIAVYQEIPGDRTTPISTFEALGNETKGAFLLESATKENDRGRYSILGFHPITEILSKAQQVTILTNNHKQTITADPFTILRQQFKQLHCKTSHPLSGFIGGMAGFITYDAIRLFENIPDNNPDDLQLPDIHFKFFKNGIVFDHQSNQAIITTIAEVGPEPEKSYEQAVALLNTIKNKIFTATPNLQDELTPCKKHDVSSNHFNINQGDEAYMAMIEKAKKYINIGDVFQVVPSKAFQRKFSVTPFNIYRALRFKSPAPYMFYLDYNDYVVVGASPERLISVHNNIVQSSPLAGTLPRGKTIEQDNALEKELLANEKEIAEHMMLVDLARNDIGAIAKPGQVKVTELLQVKKFSHVMHISSTVEGHLQDGKDALDALRAGFPAGTLTGAPKIRAMEIIDELEDTRRGLYGGAICNMDAQGNLESCIAIRMAVLKNNIATTRAGAGIVYDSIPQKEAEERKHKASTVLDAIALAEGELT